MFDGPFLTDLDSRAAIKGSRDPLGLQPIWTWFGRRIVSNLTTVSISLRDFTTLLLGYYFVERVADEGGGEGDLATFIKWEQIAAYARASVNRDLSFRGTERVRSNLLQADSRVKVSAARNAQILSNQKTYGIWGLYTVPARASALVEGDPTRLAPAARQLVEELYLPVFTKAGFRNANAIVALLRKAESALDAADRDRPLLKAVATILRPDLSEVERPIYRDHLILGGPRDQTQGLQAVLAEVLKSTLDDRDWRLSRSQVQKLIRAAHKHGTKGTALATELEDIVTCETVLAPAAALFEVLLGSDGQKSPDLSRSIRSHWGSALPTIDVDAVTQLEAKFRRATGDAESATRWLRIAQSLTSGDYEATVRLLLEHNSFVMQSRGGAAPWIEIKDDRIHVRFSDEQGGRLPARAELPELWRYPYFIESLRMMLLAVRARP